VAARPERIELEPQLSDLEIRMLRFEQDWAARTGGRESAIREQFGVSAARYHQMLHVLIDSPLALRHDPVLVRRLQRLRDARRRDRVRTLRLESQDLSE
jgi:hypothetical protein